MFQVLQYSFSAWTIICFYLGQLTFPDWVVNLIVMALRYKSTSVNNLNELVEAYKNVLLEINWIHPSA